MTVEKLIEELKKLPRDAIVEGGFKVIIKDEKGYWHAIEEFEL